MAKAKKKDLLGKATSTLEAYNAGLIVPEAMVHVDGMDAKIVCVHGDTGKFFLDRSDGSRCVEHGAQWVVPIGSAHQITVKSGAGKAPSKLKFTPVEVKKMTHDLHFKSCVVVSGLPKSNSGNHFFKLDEKNKYEGALSLCSAGFHTSPTMRKTNKFVSGQLMALVRVSGKSLTGENKAVSECFEVLGLMPWKKIAEDKIGTKDLMEAAKDYIALVQKESEGNAVLRHSIHLTNSLIGNIENVKRESDEESSDLFTNVVRSNMEHTVDYLPKDAHQMALRRVTTEINRIRDAKKKTYIDIHAEAVKDHKEALLTEEMERALDLAFFNKHAVKTTAGFTKLGLNIRVV